VPLAGRTRGYRISYSDDKHVCKSVVDGFSKRITKSESTSDL
jgi:hypothetical protein